MYPRIDSPCPLTSMQLPASGNFNCTMCSRQVHDLSHLNEAQRREFLASCAGKVCVSYKIPGGLKNLRKAALAGVFVVAANGLAVAAAALEQTPSAQSNSSDDMVEIVVAGGIDNPQSRALEKHSDTKLAADKQLELIPVVEEDDSADNI